MRGWEEEHHLRGSLEEDTEMEAYWVLTWWRILGVMNQEMKVVTWVLLVTRNLMVVTWPGQCELRSDQEHELGHQVCIERSHNLATQDSCSQSYSD